VLVAFVFVAAASPQQLCWDDFVAKTFDPALCLPEPTASELTVDGERVLYLPKEMRAWVVRDFALSAPGEAKAEHQPWLLGDIVRALRPYKDNPQLFAEELAALQQQLPGLDARSAAWVSELVRDTILREGDWDPSEDEPDDGLLFTVAWELDTKVQGRHHFWRQRRGSNKVYQMAVLYFADSAAICDTALDFEQYKQHVDNRYDEIGIVANSLRQGTDSAGRSFAYYKLFYTWDLPFPFSSYDCHADVLIHFDAYNNLLTDMSARGGDLYWGSAQGLFLPVLDRNGERVCAMMVQQFGFDLDGVPDGEDDRLQAYRSQVGSKKIFAEARFEKRMQNHKPARAMMPGRLPDLSILKR
jgi:hypothetical protein